MWIRVRVVANNVETVNQTSQHEKRRRKEAQAISRIEEKRPSCLVADLVLEQRMMTHASSLISSMA